jgi:hypothetical protein
MSLANDLLTALGVDTEYLTNVVIYVEKPNTLRVEASYVVIKDGVILQPLQEKTKTLIITEANASPPKTP